MCWGLGRRSSGAELLASVDLDLSTAAQLLFAGRPITACLCPCPCLCVCLSLQRSGRTRKARNWGEDGLTSHANGSASPPPPGAEAGDTLAHHGEALYDVTADDDMHYEPKRMRLDASSSSRLQFTHPASASPDANSAARRHQQGNNPSPDVQEMMPPALDLVGGMWCPPDAVSGAAPEPAQEQQQQPRRRRIPRKAGPRASARKSMHRRTFKRGKPQRAPVM